MKRRAPITPNIHPDDDFDETTHKFKSLLKRLSEELIRITHPEVSNISFEIVRVPDGWDYGLVDNHPTIPQTALSESVHSLAREYVALAEEHTPTMTKTTMKMTEDGDSWQARADVEYSNNGHQD